MIKTVDVKQAQADLLALLSLASQGAEVIITEDGRPLAKLAPVGGTRIAGLHSGQVWVSDDFDDPLPEEFWTGGL